MSVREQRSFCRICIANCGTFVSVDGDRVVRVRGDDAHPLSKGYLCAKGRALPDAHHSPDRLSGALIRRDGVLVPASIAEGLSAAGNVLRRITELHGRDSIGTFLGSGGYVDPAGAWAAKRLTDALDTPHRYSNASIDSTAKAAVTALMSGTAALIPHLDDLGRLVLFMGSNPVVSHGQYTAFPNPVERIRAMRRLGRVYTFDPRTTETARLSDVHLTPRMGTDHVVLAHLVRAVLQRGVDEEVASRCTGLEQLTEAVSPFDMAAVVEQTGLDVASIEGLTRDVFEAGRLAIITGTGVTMSRHANLVEWLSWALMLLTDSFDQPGGMWFNPGYFARVDQRSVLPAVSIGEPGAPSHPEIARLSGEWPASVIPDEIDSGRLRALVVLGGNLVTALPDTERVLRSLRKLDALIVLDIVRNETTEIATHVFACPDQLERPDLPALDLFIPALASQYTDAVVSAPHDRPPSWHTLAHLAAALDLDILGSRGVADGGAGGRTGTDPDTVSSEAILARSARRPDFSDLPSEGGAVVTAPAVYGWVHTRLPRGHWDVAPAALVDQLREVEAVDAMPPLVLTPRRQPKRQNATRFREGDQPDVLLHPFDAEAANVQHGDRVVVTAGSRTLVGLARVTDTIAAGAVSVPHGWADTNVNHLIDLGRLDRLSGMPLLSGTAVRIAREVPVVVGP